MEDAPPIAEPPPPASPDRRDWFGMIVSLCAIATSIASIVIAVQNSSSMDRLVQSNSWPYLQLDNSNIADSERVINLKLENNGIGPLQLATFSMRYKDRPVTNSLSLLRACCLEEGEEITSEEVFLEKVGFVVTGGPNGAVLGPKDEVLIFALPFEGANERVWQSLNRARFDLAFSACYCSVFDECWTTDFRSTARTPAKSCPAVEAPWNG